MATYVGPTASPVFVTGIINDSWAQATALSTDARDAVEDVDPVAITPLPVTPVVEAPDDLAVSMPGLQTVDLAPEDALRDELTQLLRTFIDSYYPPIVIPDGSDTWARIVATFDGQPLDQLALRARQRIDDVIDARGLPAPTNEVREYMRRDHDREAAALTTGSALNTNIADLTARKSIQLTQYETVLKAQLDALDAARAFLLGCVLAVGNKVADQARAVARQKRSLQETFFRLLNAKLEANGIELERLILEKRIALDADLSEEERTAFVFSQLVATAIEECQSIASQASAAINRISASAGVRGEEKTP